MTGLKSFRLSVAKLVVNLVAGVAILSNTASAQFGEAAGIAEAMQPEYFNRDVMLIVQELELDETQRVILDALYEDYQDDFDAGLDHMKEQFMGMKDNLSHGDQKRVMRLVFAPWEDWIVKRKRLGADFLENVKVVLNGYQLEQWPAFQRQLFREKTLYKGRFSGEMLNLFNIVRDIHLDQPMEMLVQPVMQDYDLALDEALRRREEIFNTTQMGLLRSLQENDPQMSLKAVENQITARVDVRNVNDTYIELITAALPGGPGSEFRELALETAYPRVYRELPFMRLFEAAREIEGLDESILVQIDAIETAFLAELELINADLVEQLRRYDPESELHRAKMTAARMAGDSAPGYDPPTRPNFVHREALCRTYAQQLQDILTEEEFASLPGAQRWIRREPSERPVTETPDGGEIRNRGSKGVGSAPDRDKLMGKRSPGQ